MIKGVEKRGLWQVEGLRWDLQGEFIGEKTLTFWENSFLKLWFRGFIGTLVPLNSDKWVLYEEVSLILMRKVFNSLLLYIYIIVIIICYYNI